MDLWDRADGRHVGVTKVMDDGVYQEAFKLIQELSVCSALSYAQCQSHKSQALDSRRSAFGHNSALWFLSQHAWQYSASTIQLVHHSPASLI